MTGEQPNREWMAYIITTARRPVSLLPGPAMLVDYTMARWTNVLRPEPRTAVTSAPAAAMGLQVPAGDKTRVRETWRMATQDSNLQLSFAPAAVVRVPPDDPPRRPARSGAAMPVFDIRSNEPLPSVPETTLPSLGELARGSGADGPRRGGSLWLAGDALMCACPDCRAPMTVRTWLMVADCWNCGTSIELNEEQEREARRLLGQAGADAGQPNRAENANGASVVTGAAATHKPDWDTQATRPLPSPPRRGPAVASPRPAEPQAAPTSPRQRVGQRPDGPRGGAAPVSIKQHWADEAARKRATSPPEPTAPPAAAPRRTEHGRTPASVADTRRRIRRLTAASLVHAWLSDLLRTTPAWLISLVLHFVALTLLALIPVPDDNENRQIVLSFSVNKLRNGGETVQVNPQHDAAFDLPLPSDLDLTNPQVMEAIVRADQDARQLRVDPDAVAPLRPELEQVKTQIGAPNAHRTLAARDPRVRIEMIKQEGGTTHTEAAVARALRWLALQQNDDGGWSLHGGASDEAATALALLPFLGAGQTHLNGIYTDEVSAGLRWLVDHQAENGDLRYRYKGSNNGMYAHGQGAIVLCEAFALEGDERLRAPAQKAVDFIVSAQHSAGGWRYQPGMAGDTSVVGWQLMALQSARVAGLTVPASSFQLADQFLDTVEVRDREGISYSYLPRANRPSPAMTAEALLCRMYNGWTLDRPQLREGVDWLSKRHLPDDHAPNLYYWYYGTQVFHHVGGAEWALWNDRMSVILVNSQETQGANAGSWPLRGQHDGAGGRIYTTALSACTLEVYYRHLPIFRQIDLE
jgi:hypothetical protein